VGAATDEDLLAIFAYDPSKGAKSKPASTR
jgi:hypothetical protein